MTTTKITPTRHAHGEKIGEILAGIIIISDSLHESLMRKSAREDISGNVCKKLLEENGANVKAFEVVPDEVYEIRSALLDMLNRVHLVITIGGTGSSPRDLTIEAIIPFADKRLEGFGERFRGVSSPEIGSATILTRVFLAIVGKTVICCLPGSPHAVKIGLADILLPELRHLLKHIDV